MKTIIQKVSFISIVACTSLEKTFAGIFGPDIIDKRLRGSDATVDIAGQTIVGNLMFFLGIVAVIYGIYGGFLILTAGGEDDKVKKGKSIIIQVSIGLVIIFLANSLVQWVITKILV